jgi:RNA polymerase sigma-70 factor, ECF subfamily
MFEQHGPAVRRYLRHLSGNADVANDLAQDVYLSVVRTIDSYEPRDRERAWLFRIARNVFLDHRKHSGRRGGQSGEDSGVGAPPTQIVSTDANAAIRQLDETDREAFLLAEIAGLRYGEIATMLRLTHAGVRSRIDRARLTLREVLMLRIARLTRPGLRDGCSVVGLLGRLGSGARAEP